MRLQSPTVLVTVQGGWEVGKIMTIEREEKTRELASSVSLVEHSSE